MIDLCSFNCCSTMTMLKMTMTMDKVDMVHNSNQCSHKDNIWHKQ